VTRRLKPVLKPKAIPEIAKTRYAHNFRLSLDANWQLHRMCRATGKTRSAVIEGLLTPSFSELFRRFREDKSFAEIVEETGYTPDIVRLARREYDAGWNEPLPLKIQTLNKRLELKELEIDQTLLERMSDERLERLRGQTRRVELEQQLRIERTRAVSAPTPREGR
jgi:hypothetical protein